MVFHKLQLPQLENQNGITGFLNFVVGVFLWGLITFFFLLSSYTNWFSRSLAYILYNIKPKSYLIPFWFSLLLVILLFPLTLAVILISTCVKIVQE